MSVIIMAHGRGERLRSVLGDQPKHLISLGDETILERTLRLLTFKDELNAVPGDWITVVGPQSLDYVIERYSARRMSLMEPGYCILDGLEQTADMWPGEATVVLLGDVVWSRQALKFTGESIRDEPNYITFVHTPDLSRTGGEIFAVGWHPAMAGLALEAVKKAHCRQGQYDVGQPGHLRNMLWWLENQPPPIPVQRSVVFDWTTDIDRPEDMAKLPALREACAQEPRL